jgi:DNA polymerase-1
LANYLIQGSCADELKKKMIEVDSYMEKHGLWKTLPMVLCVHDELQFENVNRDPAMDKHIKVIKGIMEDIPNLFVPIVAECEVTTTNWAEKKDFQIA